MLKSISIFSFLLFISTVCFASFEREDKVETSPEMKKLGWEAIYESHGILVHKKEVAGSPIVAFRGDAQIDSPISKIAQVLSDTPRKLEWVANAMEAKNIELKSQFERIEYNKTDAPWPLQDRDFVFQAKVSMDREKKQMTIQFHSVKDSRMPEQKDVVRGWLEDCKYILTAIDENHTKLVVEVHADPKGSVPKWIVNIFQRNWPKKTIEGIREQAQKPDVGEFAGVSDYFFKNKNEPSLSAVKKHRKI